MFYYKTSLIKRNNLHAFVLYLDISVDLLAVNLLKIDLHKNTGEKSVSIYTTRSSRLKGHGKMLSTHERRQFDVLKQQL